MPTLTVTDVTHDSRRVSPGALFVAIKGFAQDGNAFVEAARKKGALAVVSEAPALAGRALAARSRTRARPWPSSPRPCSAGPPIASSSWG